MNLGKIGKTVADVCGRGVELWNFVGYGTQRFGLLVAYSAQISPGTKKI